MTVPQNSLYVYTMTGLLLNGSGPNAWQAVYWQVNNTPDLTGLYSGYYGLLQNITVASVQQISSSADQAVIPTSAASGDLSAYYPNPLVSGLQGNPILPGLLTSASDGYVLTYSDGYYQALPTSAAFPQLIGDVNGPAQSNTVTKVQGNPVFAQSLGSLQDGYVFTWTGSVWEALPATSGVTFAGDLSGNNSTQLVVGLDGYNIQTPTHPVASSVPVFNTGLGEYQVRQLNMDDIAAGFSIVSFFGGYTVEIGATVHDPVFTASYNHTPTSAQITNTDSMDSPLTLVTPFTSGTVIGNFYHNNQVSVVFTLTAISTSTQTATQSITYWPRMFGGVGAAAATSSVTASGNTAVLSNGAVLANEGLSASPVGQTYTVSPSNQKIYFLLTGGSHTFASSGFSVPFLTPTAVSFVNQNSATVNMFLYESTYLLSATYSVLVVT